MALGSTQLFEEMNIRNHSPGVHLFRPTSPPYVSRCESLVVSQPNLPPRSVTRTALSFLDIFIKYSEMYEEINEGVGVGTKV
jgi:hypothetical protein